MAKVARYEIDFSMPDFAKPDVVSDMVSANFGYDSNKAAYKITPEGMLDINLNVQKNDKIDVIIEAFSDNSECKMNASIFRGESVAIEFNPASEMAVIELTGFVKNNEHFSIAIYNDNETDSNKCFYVRKIIFSYNMSGAWMSELSDDILIGNVNIPGTHDSAAINQTIKTLSACHYRTITEQLLNGVRLFDIRIKVKQDDNKNWYFVCCHGDLIGNEYQSLISALDELTAFFEADDGEYAKETLLVIFKVDDWNGYIEDGQQKEAKTALNNLLNSYNFLPFSNQRLGDARGKVLTFNRMSYKGNGGLGLPIGWSDNTTGESKTSGSYSYYVQDAYKPGSQDNKWTYVENAMNYASDNRTQNTSFILNFASGVTDIGIIGIYVDKNIVNKLGKLNRQQRWGWLLFDYEDKLFQPDPDNIPPVDVVSLIIDTNFSEDRAKYKGAFSV